MRPCVATELRGTNEPRSDALADALVDAAQRGTGQTSGPNTTGLRLTAPLVPKARSRLTPLGVSLLFVHPSQLSLSKL